MYVLFGNVEFEKGKHFYYACLQFLSSVIYFPWGYIMPNQVLKKWERKPVILTLENVTVQIKYIY